MSLPTIDIVRERIEQVPSKQFRLCLMTAYLYAGRISEVVGQAAPSDYTTARGPRGTDAKLDYYLDGDVDEPCVVFTVRTAKREGIVRKVAVPVNFEPWAKEVYNYFQGFGDRPVFPFTRQWVGRYVREHGVFEGLTYPIEKYVIVERSGKLKKIRPVSRHMRPYNLHAIRHSRASELVEFYGFDGFNLATYGGWTYKTAARTSGVMGRYLSLGWQSYFPKLLKQRRRVHAA
ncbi:MAG: hypothetical protein ACOWW1_05565 [archaeon]